MFTHLVVTYGPLLITLMIALECLAFPFIPGEPVLIAAAIYAGTAHHDLHIGVVILAGIAGAILGNVLGYAVGRRFGIRLMLRYGPRIGLTESRVKIGRYLFLRHGFKVVIIARFMTLLRSFAGILAGANQMPWTPFLMATVIGAVLWNGLYGLAAYYLGRQIHRLEGPVGIAIVVAIVAAAFFIGRSVARREDELRAEAERLFPGPLKAGNG